MRLNSRAWCDGERKRENDLLQHSDILDTSNMILKIVCNFCVGISNTARPLCVCVCVCVRARVFVFFNKRRICIIHTTSVHMESYRVKEKTIKYK